MSVGRGRHGYHRSPLRGGHVARVTIGLQPVGSRDGSRRWERSGDLRSISRESLASSRDASSSPTPAGSVRVLTAVPGVSLRSTPGYLLASLRLAAPLTLKSTCVISRTVWRVTFFQACDERTMSVKLRSIGVGYEYLAKKGCSRFPAENERTVVVDPPLAGVTMQAFGPTCPACVRAIPLSWRFGLRKSWGACPHCGLVIRESIFRKIASTLLFLFASGFVWFGEPWLSSLALRGTLGLASILVAALVMPGFDIRDERRDS